MKNPSGCVKSGVILTLLLGTLGLVAVCAFVFIDYSSRQQRQARAQFAPPTVLVTEPASGVSSSAGSYLGVSATAMGVSPIISVELWLDGELKEVQTSDRPEGLSPFYAHFDLLVPSEGPHMLFVRAVDANGVIGQSLPVSVIGEPKPSQVFLAVTVQEGETLEGVATAYATTPEILQELNPGLGSQPPAGTLVKVPLPPEEGPPASPSEPPPVPGSAPVEIPNVSMLQIASVKSPGLLGSGPFLPEPFFAKAGPPTAPTGLQAEVKGCKITLRWNDNADNEENYYVYMVPLTFQGFAVPFATLKPSPSTGPAWFEIQEPLGGSVSLWVEAANSYGAQPSNIAWVYIPPVSGCPLATVLDLDVTVLDMTVAGDYYDRAYCYISFENHPERRFPVAKENFILLKQGKSWWVPYVDGFTIPVPKDKSLDLSGSCLAWLGNSLIGLGSFSGSLPPDTWNGDRQALRWKAHEIGISVKPRLEKKWPYTTDPTLPAPYDLREEPRPDAPNHPRDRALHWKWDGDPKKIDGYVIFLNGQSFDHTLGPDPSEWVQLPGECGRQIIWQVAAREKGGTALSHLSEPVKYDQPPCQAYLRVRFDRINLHWTDDGWPTPGFPCETLEAYFQISVGEVTRSFWGGNFFLPMKCGVHYFPDIMGGPYNKLYGPVPYVITIPLGPDEKEAAISARFWDADDNPDDLFATFTEIVGTLGGRWLVPECKMTYTAGNTTDSAESYLTFSWAFYPNTCRDTPPASGDLID